jgi:hypothetical protein
VFENRLEKKRLHLIVFYDEDFGVRFGFGFIEESHRS